MIKKTFFHTLPDGTTGKFTILDRIINGELFYYAKVIDIESEYYRNLSKEGQELFHGVELTNGKQQSINYRDAVRLEKDIINKYGNEYLKTEI